ncbi:hypothetical protein MMC26_000989, partial [Xylographa opegraphella]|nr:hypothetical protein [Xylographa opegraphella]
FVGKVKRTDIVDPKWLGALDTALGEAQEKEPRIEQAEIRGATPHTSPAGSDDPKKHISVVCNDKNGNESVPCMYMRMGPPNSLRMLVESRAQGVLRELG